jgi:hypothetical protein
VNLVGAVVVMPDGTFLGVGSEIPGMNDDEVWDRRGRCARLSAALAAGGRLETMTREQTDDARYWRKK